MATYSLQIIRGPYLQVASSNSITIRWRTDSLCTSVIKYGLSDTSLNNTYINIVPKTEHSITLTNLTSNTRYHYAITQGNTVLSGGSNHYFKTAPVASESYDQPIRFWAVGDLSKQTIQQIQVKDAFVNYTQSNYIDGWLMLGDNGYENGLDSEYQFGFFNYYQNPLLSRLPLFPVVGNHDYANDSILRKTHAIPYYNIFAMPSSGQCGGVPSNTSMYYSFNYGNVHFINLDSYGLEQVGSSYYPFYDTLHSPQIIWLKQDLNANTLPWIVVSFHHPPYCLGTHNSDIEGDLIAIRTQVIPILERYNVDLVLNGHDHSYQRSHFIRGHYGLESSFDSTTHIKQLSNGFYDGSPNSCAYVKHAEQKNTSDSGAVFVVAGSGSAIPLLPQSNWPHNAMVYSNYLDNGSLLLTIEGNRLTGEWLCNDTAQVVKDRFTIFKNVGVKKELHVTSGTRIQLRASWPAGAYVWSQGDTTRSISYTAYKDSTFIVSDSLGCIQDTFMVSLPVYTSNNEFMEAKVYPNPTNQNVVIEHLNHQAMQFDLLTIQGQLIYTESLPENQGNTTVEIPARVPNGCYLMRIRTSQQILYQDKLVVIGR